MAPSASGILTLIMLIVAGPLFYGITSLRRRFRTPGTTPAAAPPSQPEGREQSGSGAYLVSLLGYAIGIGNVWRFPYLVGKYGGGAFVFAYLVCLFLVAIPLYMMELIIGQHTRLTTVPCFTMIRPRWRSLGWAQAMMLFYGLAYYNVLIAYACNYIAGALVTPLPWSEEARGTHVGRGAAERFWTDYVLNAFPEGEGGSALGPLQSNLVVALLAVWTMVFFALAFGKEILAQVTWVTVVGPVVLMGCFIVRTAFLPGAADGIRFYLGKFDVSHLLNLELWAIACGQILFSLSPGMGTAITLSSYTKQDEDVYRVCLIVALSNSCFSIAGGFAIFSVLGSLAHSTGQTVEEVAMHSGTGLAFISIAEGTAISFGSAANAVAVLFFVMLLSLGLDSTFAWAETFVNYVQEAGAALGIVRPKWQVVLVTCAGFFLAGLPFCTRRGNELLDVVDHFGLPYFLLLGCFLESVMLKVDFGGLQRLSGALHAATAGNKDTPGGRRLRPPLFWRVCYSVTVPLFTCGLFFYMLAFDIRTPYGGYAPGLQVTGWLILTVLLILAPLTFFDRRAGTLPPMGRHRLDSACDLHSGHNGTELASAAVRSATRGEYMPSQPLSGEGPPVHIT